MKNTLRMLLIVAGLLAPLALQAAPPPNNKGYNQKQNPNLNQNQNQNQKQIQNRQQNQNQNQKGQNQNGPNQTAQAIQFAVQQLMSLDKNQSSGVELNEVVNNQVLTLCQNADADKNGSVTAAEFTTALTSVATTANTAGGNSTTAVLLAAGCGQGNNQLGNNQPGAMGAANGNGQLGRGAGPNQGAGQGVGQGNGRMQRGPGGGTRCPRCWHAARAGRPHRAVKKYHLDVAAQFAARNKKPRALWLSVFFRND